MLDWDNDTFMSEWDKTYVSTNVKPGMRPYDRGLFLKLNENLAHLHPELRSLSHALIVSLGRIIALGLLADFPIGGCLLRCRPCRCRRPIL